MKILGIGGNSFRDNKLVYGIEIAKNQFVKVAHCKNINQLYIQEDPFGNMVFTTSKDFPGDIPVDNIELSEYQAKEIIQFVSDYIAEKLRKMTQFELELYGYKGKFWKRDAERRLEKTKKSVENGEITINENGVARNCIGRVVMSDMMDILEFIFSNFNRENTEKALEKETQEFLKEYRKQQENHEYSLEELTEMRAAFGEGETVVDVFSGKKIEL